MIKGLRSSSLQNRSGGYFLGVSKTFGGSTLSWKERRFTDAKARNFLAD
jgi:hypothetical protein